MDYTFTCERFDIRRTLFCGQAFRWKELDGRFCGIAGGRYAEISDNGDSTYTVHGIEKSDISYWQSYFDLDTDYDALIKQFSQDKYMRLACKENPGIRVLRQEPFETLISSRVLLTGCVRASAKRRTEAISSRHLKSLSELPPRT